MIGFERYRDVALVVVAVGVVFWVGWETPRLPKAAGPAASEAWRGPIDIEAPVAADLAIINQRRPWGAAPQPSPQPIPSDPAQSAAGVWRIGGIVESNAGFTALVLLQKPGAPKPDILSLRTGEALPDGRRITAIEATRMTVAALDNSSAIEYRLFEPRR